MTFGEKLRESRITIGFTQKQLADKVGAKHNSISDWENNKNKPDPDTIELLCGILDISPNYLLNSNGNDFSLSEKNIIKKYRGLDDHGKEMVDFTLLKEYNRSIALQKGHEDNVVTLPSQIKAAHNDHLDEENEQEKVHRDLSNLKRPK